MAVAGTVTPLPKPQPDISKINTFANVTVTVTKHPAARNTPGAPILSAVTMTNKQLFAAMTDLPTLNGAGFYLWNVVDAAGNGEDTWMIKYGGDVPGEYSMAGPTNGAAPGVYGGAAPEGTIQMGHGFFYNEALGTITTPWRTVHNWKPGEDLPRAPAAAGQPQQPAWSSSLQMPGANAPWATGGWGGYPVNDGTDAKIKALESTLAEERQRRREDDMRAEQTRRDAEVRQMIADSNARFEKLIEKLATKPSGESSPELLAIKAQNETLQRRIDEEKREREARERDDRMREDMRRDRENTERMFREMSDRMVEATKDKSDPMLPMLMNMITSSQTSAMEIVKVIQSTTATASTAAERQTQQLVAQLQGAIMNPMQLMQMMQASKGDSAEMTRIVTDHMGGMLNTQRTMFESLLDIASQGNQPAWVGMVEKGLDKIGSIGQVLAQRQQQPAQPQRIVRVGVPVDPATGRPIVTPPPAAAPPGLSAVPGSVPGTPAPQSTAPKEMRNTPTAPEQPTNVVPIKPGKGKKGRKAKASGNALPPPANPNGYSLAEMREMEPETIAEATEALDDNAFFGEIMQFIPMIRENWKSGMKPEGVAELLLRSREHFATLTVHPPAVQLYMAEHIEVLVDRLLPEADDDFREEVVDVIEEQLERESAGQAG